MLRCQTSVCISDSLLQCFIYGSHKSDPRMSLYIGSPCTQIKQLKDIRIFTNFNEKLHQIYAFISRSLIYSLQLFTCVMFSY